MPFFRNPIVATFAAALALLIALTGMADAAVPNHCPAGQQLVDVHGRASALSMTGATGGRIACGAPIAGAELQTFTGLAVSSDHGVELSCPPGKHVLAMAGRVINGHRRVVIDDFSRQRTSVRVRAREIHGGTRAKWAVRADALCA